MGDRDSQYDAWANFINNAYPKGNEQVTINQAVVSSNIRGLQSRTHKRGKELAKFERSRTAVKTAVKNLRLVGYPVDIELLDFKDALGESVIALAKDQTLDRQLLKQQYVLQGQSRPPRAAKPPKTGNWRSVGSVVRTSRPDVPLYIKGILGKIIQDDGTTLLLDFNGLGNPEGSYEAQRGAPTNGIPGSWWVLASEVERA